MYKQDKHSPAEQNATAADTPLLVSVPEAARLLGVGTTLCWDLIHRRQLFSIRLGRRVLVPRAALDRLISMSYAMESHDTA